MTDPDRRTLKKLFWWTFGIFGVLLLGLVVLSLANPDTPFTYVLQ